MLNTNLSIQTYAAVNWNCKEILANYIRKYGKVVHVYLDFTVKADSTGAHISLFSLPIKPTGMSEVLPPFLRCSDGSQVQTRYISGYGVIQAEIDLNANAEYQFEWVFLCD